MRSISGYASLLLVTAACGSVEWQQLPPAFPDRWRQLELCRAERIFVLARDQTAAEEAAAEIMDVVGGVERATDQSIGTGLVLAVSRDDPLLLPSVAQLTAAMARWHATAVGRPLPDGARASIDDLVDLDIDLGDGQVDVVSDRRALARLLSAGVPKDARELALPDELLARVDWIVVAPTASCIEAVVGETIDATLENAELTFFERAAAALLLPSARGRVCDEVHAQVALRLYEACFAAATDDPWRDRALLTACLERAGLPAGSSVFDPETGTDATRELDARALVDMLRRRLASALAIQGFRLPHDSFPEVAASGTPRPEQLAALSVLQIAAVIDLRTAAEGAGDDARSEVERHGFVYVHLPVSEPDGITRTNAARLRDAIASLPDPPGSGSRVLVHDADGQRPAALIALIAFDRGVSADEARRIGAHYGLSRLAPALDAVLVRSASEGYPR